MAQRENSPTTQVQNPSSERKNDVVYNRYSLQRRQTEGSQSCLFAQRQHREIRQSPQSQNNRPPLSHSQELQFENSPSKQSSSSVPFSPTSESSDSGVVKQLNDWNTTKRNTLSTTNPSKRVPPPIPPRPKKPLPKQQLDKSEPKTRNETKEEKNDSIHKEQNIPVKENPQTPGSEGCLFEKAPIPTHLNESRSVGQIPSQSHSLKEKKPPLQKRNAFRVQAHLSLRDNIVSSNNSNDMNKNNETLVSSVNIKSTQKQENMTSDSKSRPERIPQTSQSPLSSSLGSNVSDSSNERKTNSDVVSHSQIQNEKSSEKNEIASPRSQMPEISIAPSCDSDKNKQRSSSVERKYNVVRPIRRPPEKFNTLTTRLSDTTTEESSSEFTDPHRSLRLHTHRKSVSLSSPSDFLFVQDAHSSSPTPTPIPTPSSSSPSKSKHEQSTKKRQFPLARVGRTLVKALGFNSSTETITEINETESETYSKDVSHPPQKEMLQSRKEHKHRRTQSMSVNMNQESEMMLLSTSPVDKEEPNKQKKSTKDEKEKTRNPFRLITAQISSLVRHDNKESNMNTSLKNKPQSPRKKLTRSSSTQDFFASSSTPQQTSETSPLNSPKRKDKEPQIKLKITKDMLPEKTKALYKDVELHAGGIYKFEVTNDVRYNVAAEIVVTEKSYNQSLGKVIQCFIVPLREAAKSSSPILTLEEIKNIFGQWEVIYGFSCEFLRQLEDKLQHWDNATQIGNCFLQMADFFKVYAAYFNNYTLALRTLDNAKKNSAFVKFISSESIIKQTGLTTLTDFLVMPVQRIPRYILLLNELKKKTPEDHPDFTVLIKAIDKVQTIANQNEAMQKEVENLQTIVTIQQRLRHTLLDVGYRRFVKEGSLTLIKSDGSQEDRYYFLFNDILIEAIHSSSVNESTLNATSTKTNKSPSEYSYQRTIPLLNLVVHSNPDTDQLQNTFTLVQSDGNNIILCASNAKEKDEWVTTMETVVKQLLDKEFSRKEKFKKPDGQTNTFTTPTNVNRNS